MSKKIMILVSLLLKFAVPYAASIVVSSSPSGRYILLQNNLSPNVYICDVSKKDTIANFLIDKKNTFFGWKNDESFYYAKDNGKRNLTFGYYNVKSGLFFKVTDINTDVLSIVKEHEISIPPFFDADEQPFFTFLCNNIIYEYNLIKSKKNVLVNIDYLFSKSAVVNNFSSNSKGQVVLNINNNGANGIYFFRKKDSKLSLVAIDTNNINFDSYCYFFNHRNVIIYYKYFTDKNKLTITVNNYDLDNLKLITAVTMPKGTVPSLALDLPSENIILINFISDSVTKLNPDILHDNNLYFQNIYKHLNKLIDDTIDSFDFLQMKYDKYSLKMELQ